MYNSCTLIRYNIMTTSPILFWSTFFYLKVSSSQHNLYGLFNMGALDQGFSWSTSGRHLVD